MYGGEAREEDCVYQLKDSLHKLSVEAAALVDDMAEGMRGEKETLRLLEKYVQKFSEDMAKLDKDNNEKDGKEKDGKDRDGKD
ncbi:hypothetical protein [Clostridium sp. AM58-1XD]|uniref:hypothetical protein n=1 Tax=Clostridium sp. AM58-1XD TaxID=2292307 RepID=UPI00269D3E15